MMGFLQGGKGDVRGNLWNPCARANGKLKASREKSSGRHAAHWGANLTLPPKRWNKARFQPQTLKDQVTRFHVLAAHLSAVLGSWNSSASSMRSITAGSRSPAQHSMHSAHSMVSRVSPRMVCPVCCSSSS